MNDFFYKRRPISKNSLRPVVVASLVLTVLLMCLPAAGLCLEDATGIQNRIGTAFENAARALDVPGAVLGVRTRNGETRFFATGLADLDKKVPMDVDRRFRIGSVTKTFTATAVLMLADQGKLSLDATVESLLPGRVPGGKHITVRMLLRMRSGLSEYTGTKDFQKIIEEDANHRWTFGEVMKLVSVEDEPDTEFAYRNTNYRILGKIVETLSKMPYGAFIDQKICRPLGMRHTVVPSDRTMPPHSADGYLIVDGVVENLGTAFDPSWAGPAGNIISTAGDMLIWLDALKNGRLISKSSRLAMYDFKPGILHGDLCGYGLGMINFRGALGHGGNYADIFTSALFSYRGYDFIVLANGRKKGTRGDATDVFLDMIAKLKPDPSWAAWLDRQLLNHTSGIPDFIRNPDFFDLNFKNPLKQWTLKERIADTLCPRLWF